MSRSVKFFITPDGNTRLAHSRAERGYGGEAPVIEVTDVPDDVTDSAVLATYQRCIIRPLMHAEMPLSWRKIQGARPGDILQLEDRPHENEDEKSLRVNGTLSPDAVVPCDERGAEQSQENERLNLGLKQHDRVLMGSFYYTVFKDPLQLPGRKPR